MNIITIIKRENFIIQNKNILVLFIVLFSTISMVLLLFSFDNIISTSYIDRKISYDIIIKLSKFSNYALYLLSFIIAPIFTVGVLSEDKQNGTLDIIITSNINRDTYILGKFFQRFCTIIFTSFSIAPFIVLTHIFGGNTLERIIYILSFFLVVCMLLVMSGICISAYISDDVIAMVLHYFEIVLIGLSIYYYKNLFYVNHIVTFWMYFICIALVIILYELTKYGKVFKI